ncbi:MAG: glycosyl hydrolase family 5, partial [Candidatus Binatia bacterium]
MDESSDTGPAGSTDVRDRLGFAIREIFAGKANASGQFADELRHGTAANAQSVIYVSSTDPWHRSSDIDHDAEHIGFDRLVKSGLADGAPMMVPVGVLYDTTENAAAEIEYLTKRGYRISGVEIGEEPDGQYVTPEDYGALYIQWAEAIHKIDPNIKLGGPSFQDIKPDTRGGKYALGNAVWLGRFINYLKKRHRSQDFSFFSFEWYPFDDVCKPTGPQVKESTRMLRQYVNVFRRHGLDEKIPLIISEYGYSAFSTAAEMDIEGALFNADTIGAFLSLGGKRAYLYGYEPDQVERDFPCTSGNNMLFLDAASGAIQYPTATYFGAQMTMREWLQPTGGEHKLYHCEIDSENEEHPPIAAYAVLRPDEKWSLMLINRDAVNAWRVSIRFNDREKKATGDNGADLYQFSGTDYQWDVMLG